MFKVENIDTRLIGYMQCWIYSKVIDFSSMFHFYTPWKRKKPSGIKMEHWPREVNDKDTSTKPIESNLVFLLFNFERV